MLTPPADLRPGFATVEECLESLAAAADTSEAHLAAVAFVRSPDLYGHTHLLRPARRAWEEAFAAAWATEAGLLEQGPRPDDVVHDLSDCTSGGPYPIERAPYARTLAEVAERGRASGRRYGRRPR